MHQAQGQAFGQQQALSQQISSRMPAPYQGVGLGASGFQGGFGQGMGYNYGGGMGGYGPGNSFGNAMTGAIGGIGHAVGGGMGVVGAIGGGMMGGIGGAMMGWSAGGLIGGGIQHVANSFMEGAHEQASMERTLSQFKFQNASAPGGRGFSRQDSMQIGNMVRQMERIPEMLTSFGELNRIMDKMGQMGLMQGARDAGEFMKKFKDTVSTLKDMAKVMGTTMEGAMQAFQESRMSGFYSNSAITRNVLNRQVTSSVTGMNQNQVGALQQYGAELSHSLGGSRRGGATSLLRTAGQLGMANQMGILTNDQIMEYTGKEGAEGIQDLSASMGQLAYRMGGSNVGTALTLALGAQKDGRYTGEMDQELVEKVRRGEISLAELKSLARRKASTRGAKLSFAAHKNRLRTEMSGAVGAEGIAMQLQEILGERGWSNPDAQSLVMQRFGASEEQANLLQTIMPNLQGLSSQMGLAGNQEARNSARNAVMAEHGWDAIKHKIGKKISHYTTDWAKDLGVGVRDYFQNWADEFVDEISGRYTKEVTKRVSDAVKFSSSSLGGMVQGAAGISKTFGANRLDIGSGGGLTGLAAQGMHWLGGGESAGQRADWIMSHTLGGRHSIHASGSLGSMFMSGKNGMNVFDTTISGRMSGATNEGVDKVRAALLSGTFGEDQLKEIKGALNDQEFNTLLKAYKNAMNDTNITQETDQGKRARMTYEAIRKQGIKGMSVLDMMAERTGQKQITSLGKVKQRTGLQDNDIVAALQAATGGAYRGSTDFGEVAQGLSFDTTNIKEIQSRLKELDSKVGTFKNPNDLWKERDVGAWNSVKKVLDSDGDLARIAMAITDKDAVIQDALNKKPESWVKDKQVRAAMVAKGIDPDRLAAKMGTSEGAAEIDELKKNLKAGRVSKGDISTYLNLKSAEGLAEITGRFKERGQGINSRLGKNTGAVAELEKTKEGANFVKLLREQGKSLEGAKFDEKGNLNFKDDGALADAYNKLSPEQKAAAGVLGGSEMASVAGYQSALRGHKGRGGLNGLIGKGGVQEILDKAGYGGIGFEGAAGEFREALKGKLGKNGKLDKGEIEEVIKMLVDVKSKDLDSKDGKVTGSTAVGEADVAKQLAVLSENNKIATQILADLASGKKVGGTKE